MQRLPLTFLGLLLAATPALAGEISLSPPVIGPLKADSSLESLKKQNVPVRVLPVYVGEGICRWGTLLYPDEPQSIEVFWKGMADAEDFDCDHPPEAPEMKRFDQPLMARISNPDSPWKTKDGVGINTRLEALEKLYGPFTFGGFGWDYAGGCCFDNDRFPEGLGLVLDHRGELSDAAVKGWEDKLLGDHGIHSASLTPQVKNHMRIYARQLTVAFSPQEEVEDALADEALAEKAAEKQSDK